MNETQKTVLAAQIIRIPSFADNTSCSSSMKHVWPVDTTHIRHEDIESNIQNSSLGSTWKACLSSVELVIK